MTFIWSRGGGGQHILAGGNGDNDDCEVILTSDIYKCSVMLHASLIYGLKSIIVTAVFVMLVIFQWCWSCWFYVDDGWWKTGQMENGLDAIHRWLTLVGFSEWVHRAVTSWCKIEVTNEWVPVRLQAAEPLPRCRELLHVGQMERESPCKARGRTIRSHKHVG